MKKDFSRKTYQGSGQTQDGEEGTSRRKGHVFVVAGLFTHFHIGPCDVVREYRRDHWVLLLTQGNVPPHQLHVQRVKGHRGLHVVLVDVGDVLG